MSLPTSIEAWLRKAGFVYENAQDTSPKTAVLTLAGYKTLEWSKALVEKHGLLVLRPTSPSNPSMTGVLFTHLNSGEVRATAEGIDHLMTTPALDVIMQGILDHPHGCLIEGLGTARATFSPLRR